MGRCGGGGAGGRRQVGGWDRVGAASSWGVTRFGVVRVVYLFFFLLNSFIVCSLTAGSILGYLGIYTTASYIPPPGPLAPP